MNLGYTQEQIANFLAVDRTTISHYETGVREASLVHLSKLADLFGIEIEDFAESNLINKSGKMAFAFRREGLIEEDLNSIASFQKIVKNYLHMLEIQNAHE